MNKKQQAQMKEYFEEMDTVQAMESTYSGDVDMPDNVILIEEETPEFEEEEEYSDEEMDMFLQKVNFEDSRNTLSFDEMMPKVAEPSGVMCQLKENIVHPRTLVLREWKETSPSVCVYKDCFYDGAEAIGYKKWSKVPEGKRKIALAALKEHNARKHQFQGTDLVDKSQIPTSWLSPMTM